MEAIPKKPVWKRWWFWVLVVFVLIIVSAGSSGSSSDDGAKVENDAPPVAMVVDAPHLLGLTIDQAREELGPPDERTFIDPTAEQLALGTTTWSNQFTIGEYTILLDFDVATREVTEFFIDTNDESGVTRDWEALLPISGVSKESTDYTIKAVEALAKPGYFTGVIVTE
jgi:hypothetical protein